MERTGRAHGGNTSTAGQSITVEWEIAANHTTTGAETGPKNELLRAGDQIELSIEPVVSNTTTAKLNSGTHTVHDRYKYKHQKEPLSINEQYAKGGYTAAQAHSISLEITNEVDEAEAPQNSELELQEPKTEAKPKQAKPETQRSSISAGIKHGVRLWRARNYLAKLFGANCGQMYELFDDAAVNSFVFKQWEEHPEIVSLLKLLTLKEGDVINDVDHLQQIDHLPHILDTIEMRGKHKGAVLNADGEPDYSLTWLTHIALTTAIAHNPYLQDTDSGHVGVLYIREDVLAASKALQQWLSFADDEQGHSQVTPIWNWFRLVNPKFKKLGTQKAPTFSPSKMSKVFAALDLESQKADGLQFPESAEILLLCQSILSWNNSQQRGLKQIIARKVLLKASPQQEDQALQELTQRLCDIQQNAEEDDEGSFYASRVLTFWSLQTLESLDENQLTPDMQTTRLETMLKAITWLASQELDPNALKKIIKTYKERQQEGLKHVTVNKNDGTLRERFDYIRLLREYPLDKFNVWPERDLFYKNKNGEFKEAKMYDPHEKKEHGSRIDFIVRCKKTKKIVHLRETTSRKQKELAEEGERVGKPKGKGHQIEFRRKLRQTFKKVYIQDPATKKYQLLPPEMEIFISGVG